MNASKGLNQMKINLDQDRQRIINEYNTSFERLRQDIDTFIGNAGTSYIALHNFLSSKNNPQREFSPRGFMYGSETAKNYTIDSRIVLPHIYEFMKWPATAIEMNSPNAYMLFNFALRAITTYVLGDSTVYLLDSNISGDFNRLSSISTDVNDNDTEKNYFHYITSDAEKDAMLTNLSNVMDRNIRNYVSRYPDLYSYNNRNQMMFEAYHFVFIRDIANVFPERGQIDRLARMVSQGNATKAGIFLFYTYDKSLLDDAAGSYYADTAKSLLSLVNMSHSLEQPSCLCPGSELNIEPKATMREVDETIRFVAIAKSPSIFMSFKDDIDAQLSSGKLWQEHNDEKNGHLLIPIGFKSAAQKLMLDISFKGASPHIYVGGKSGSGKSILLHNLIINASLHYSPDQLRFFLVDMKGGVSFASYKKLPHLAALSASSSRHYAESLLSMFCREIEQNNSIFKRYGVSSLSEYNERAKSLGLSKIPYKFAVIDEFQELFTVNDSVARNAQRSIELIHRTGRSAGVVLALCTQQPPSVIDRSQVGIKMSLVCRANDSMALIGNTGASRLKGIGRAILNTSETGDEKYNLEFQVPFINEEKEVAAYVAKMNEIWRGLHDGDDPLDHLIYDDNDHSVPISANDRIFCEKNNTDEQTANIWIGAPAFYRKEHVKFCLHRDSQSNVAIVGADRPSALRIVGMTILQMIKAYHDGIGCRIYVSDMQRKIESTYGKLAFLADRFSNVTYGSNVDLKEIISEVYTQLEMRRQNPSQSIHEPEILYAVLDLKPDGNFTASKAGGFNFSTVQEKSCFDMLSELISLGPDFGIHVMVYCYNYQNLSQLLNNYSDSLLNKMEVKIALRGGNSTKLFSHGNGEIVGRNGEGFIRMPQEMGLQYVEGDDYGDPFRIYDVVDDERLKDGLWNTLFEKLANV